MSNIGCFKPEMCSSKLDDPGAVFKSYSEFSNALDQYEKDHFCCFRINDSKSVERANLDRNYTISPEFKYVRVVFVCTHFGSARPRGKGICKRLKYSATECKATFCLNYIKKLNVLKVNTLEACLNHTGHPTTADFFEKEYKNQKLSVEEQKVVKEWVSLEPKNEKLQTLVNDKFSKRYSLSMIRQLKSRTKVKRVIFPKKVSDAIKEAIKEVKGGMPMSNAAKKYSLPKALLNEKISGKTGKDWRYELTEYEERKLANWIIQLSRKGNTVDREAILTNVHQILNDTINEDRFKENRSHEDWYCEFCKRYPELHTEGVRILDPAPERTATSEENIRKWFTDVQTNLLQNGVDMNNFPSERIFNVDETGFQMTSPTHIIFSEQSVKHPYVLGDKKVDNISTVVCGSASGQMLKPLIVYPGSVRYGPESLQRLGLAKDKFPGCEADITQDGWVNPDKFEKWVRDVFIPSTATYPKPIVLFVDGHIMPYASFLFDEMCRMNQILYQFIPIHLSPVIQPLDQAWLHMKPTWTEAAHTLSCVNEGFDPNSKSEFAQVYKLVWEVTYNWNTIRNLFTSSGLCPWNPEAFLSSGALYHHQNREATQVDSALPCGLASEHHKEYIGKESIQNMSKQRQNKRKMKSNQRQSPEESAQEDTMPLPEEGYTSDDYDPASALVENMSGTNRRELEESEEPIVFLDGSTMSLDSQTIMQLDTSFMDPDYSPPRHRASTTEKRRRLQRATTSTVCVKKENSSHLSLPTRGVKSYIKVSRSKAAEAPIEKPIQSPPEELTFHLNRLLDAVAQMGPLSLLKYRTQMIRGQPPLEGDTSYKEFLELYSKVAPPPDADERLQDPAGWQSEVADISLPDSRWQGYFQDKRGAQAVKIDQDQDKDEYELLYDKCKK